ncbi:MAG: hypothetical protein KGL15_04840 [Acidobacteriota bacterium]|nr:hypothetical protein [Acidobacteriota bacterium]
MAITVGAATAVMLLAAMGSAATAKRRAPRARTVVVATKRLPKLGVVLVNSAGRALYIFMPDKQKKVTCVSTCTSIWPQLTLPKGAKPKATDRVKLALIGSDPNSGGGRVLTYNRWPLYTYVGDGGPGTANGQALQLNGGLWYVISPSGTPIHTKP